MATFVAHSQALRVADLAFAAERDRRYAEVDVEREKALKIKETADLAALTLASENQRLRDEAHNNLLSQWQNERTHYVTIEKFDATIGPLIEARSTSIGSHTTTSELRTVIYGVLIFLGTVALVISPHVH